MFLAENVKIWRGCGSSNKLTNPGFLQLCLGFKWMGATG